MHQGRREEVTWLTEGTQRCPLPVLSRSVLQAQLLCPRTSVPAALMEFSSNEEAGFGVAQPGWDGAASLHLDNSQTSARWMDGERDKGGGTPGCPPAGTGLVPTG